MPISANCQSLAAFSKGIYKNVITEKDSFYYAFYTILVSIAKLDSSNNVIQAILSQGIK